MQCAVIFKPGFSAGNASGTTFSFALALAFALVFAFAFAFFPTTAFDFAVGDATFFSF